MIVNHNACSTTHCGCVSWLLAESKKACNSPLVGRRHCPPMCLIIAVKAWFFARASPMLVRIAQHRPLVPTRFFWRQNLAPNTFQAAEHLKIANAISSPETLSNRPQNIQHTFVYIPYTPIKAGFGMNCTGVARVAAEKISKKAVWPDFLKFANAISSPGTYANRLQNIQHTLVCIPYTL